MSVLSIIRRGVRTEMNPACQMPEAATTTSPLPNGHKSEAVKMKRSNWRCQLRPHRLLMHIVPTVGLGARFLLLSRIVFGTRTPHDMDSFFGYVHVQLRLPLLRIGIIARRCIYLEMSKSSDELMLTGPSFNSHHVKTPTI